MSNFSHVDTSVLKSAQQTNSPSQMSEPESDISFASQTLNALAEIQNLPSRIFGEGARAGVAWVWVCGGALVTILALIVALFGFVFFQGMTAFWPQTFVQTERGLGTYHRTDVKLSGEKGTVYVFKGNRDFGVPEFEEVDLKAWPSFKTAPIKLESFSQSEPWFVERAEWGVFMGAIASIKTPSEVISNPSPNVVQNYVKWGSVHFEKINTFIENEINPLNSKLSSLRVEQKRWLRLNPKREPSSSQDFLNIEKEIAAATLAYNEKAEKLSPLQKEDTETLFVFQNFDGATKEYPASQVIRAFQPNTLNFLQKTVLFAERIFEFVTAKPREANTAGGVFPAIFGTVAMTFLMILFVMPLGILTAIYLREVAAQGFFVSLVRVAVGNLAGVPSIVYGVFGLGFFCYSVGSSIDAIFFQDKLPSPTFGTGGWIWASLTMALLTVPVVVVSTEEALSSVPRTLREASYGCGATRFQTIFYIVLPKAAPGILTGLILAMARGVGEVAPLLLTGVVKLAPTLPIDSQFPFVHLERSFMHLGFHIYDLGFQSRSTELSRPMVFASTLLLLGVVLTLNFMAFKIRTKLRKRFEGRGAF